MVEPLNKLIVLPDCGLEAEIVETDGDGDELLYKDLENLHSELPNYWARHTRRLGDTENPQRKDILQLREMDQAKLAIEIYRVSYGDNLILGAACPACKDPANYSVDLKEMSETIRIPDEIDGPDPLMSVTMPRTGHVVQVGFLSGQEILEEMMRPDVSLLRLELAHIRTVDGAAKFSRREVRGWPGRDHLAVREVVAEMRTWYETRKRFKHTCKNKVVMNILVDPRFQFPAVPLQM